nr:hypothetical protein Iba_chr10cCG11000 [Ipomoea batatas]
MRFLWVPPNRPVTFAILEHSPFLCSPVSVTPPPSVYSNLGPSLLPSEFWPANTTPPNSQPSSVRPSPVAPARGEQIPAAAATVPNRPVATSGFSTPTSSVPNSMEAATPILDSMEAAALVSDSMEAAAPTSDSMAAAATASDSMAVAASPTDSMVAAMNHSDSMAVAATASDSVVAATTHSESVASESSRGLPTTASQATVGSSQNQSIPLSRLKRQRRPNPKYFNDKFVNLTTSHPVVMSIEPRTVLSSLCSIANYELRRRQRREEPKRQSATSEAPTSDGDPASPVLSVSVAASSELRSTVLSVVYWEIAVIIIDESDLMIYGVSRE